MAGDGAGGALAVDQGLDGIGVGRGPEMAGQRQGVAGTVGTAGLEQGLGHGGDVGLVHGPIVPARRSGDAFHGKIAA